MNTEEQFIESILHSNYPVFFTGAGISTNSGIPDFRGPKGFWKTNTPIMFQNFMSQESMRMKYWTQSVEFKSNFQEKTPNEGHTIISEIINSLNSDRVGIVAYAAQAIPQVPLTTDFASVKNFLQIIDTDMLSSQGTSIDSALNLSANFFDQNSETNRVLILLSDGEDHDDIPESLINLIIENNINLISIGVGQDNGSTIPIKVNGRIDSYKKDSNGEVVITKRNSEILNKIASSSGGEYIDGNITEEALENVKVKLDKIDKSEFETSQFVEYKQQFQIFILLALLFIIVDIFIFQTKTKWIQNLNLFNENEE